MMNFFPNLLIISFSAFIFNVSVAQKKYEIATVAFYNVENLFDTINSADLIDGKLNKKDTDYHKSVDVTSESIQKLKHSPSTFKGRYTHKNLKNRIAVRDTYDDEYTPKGKNGWSQERYLKKLNHLAKVISEIGYEKSQTTPAIVGLSEVENRQVIEDLVQTGKLAESNYGIIHYNSFDARGIDCALLYKKDVFELLDSKRHVLKIYDKAKNNRRIYTRDQLVVHGKLSGEKMYFIVNHWPSRSGGEKKSRPKRMKAAELTKQIVANIQIKDKNAKIIIMGDLNDDPNSASIAKVLQPKTKINKTKGTDLYNPMAQMRRRGEGSLAWRDSWNLFDQMIVSAPFIENRKDFSSFKLFQTAIFKKKYLQQVSGRFKGYPFRTKAGGTYKGGYSDHFPVYMYLVREAK